MNKTIIAFVVAALGHADSFSTTVDKLRTTIEKTGVDVTDRKAVSQAIIWGVGEKRGLKVRVRTNNAGEPVQSGQLVLDHKDEHKVKAAMTDLGRLTSAIVGKSSKEVEPVVVSRAARAAAKEFVALCGSKKAAMAALKTVK
jgi:hypothetical protein